MSEIELTPFDEVVSRYASGEMIIMVDESDRENEGDFIVATEAARLEHVNTMLKVGRGLMCVAITADIAEKLNIPLQTIVNNSLFHTAFTVSLDLKDAGEQGATFANRLQCMKALVDENSLAEDFVVPGNVFPLIANRAGTLGRMGQTEGCSDLAQIAGFKASSLLCEIIAEDGTMLRGQKLADFAKKNNYAITSVLEVKNYRLKSKPNLRQISESQTEVAGIECQAIVFFDDKFQTEHLALIFGKLQEAPLVRVHSECLTGDIFGSRRCDCGPQLSSAIDLIKNEGGGILVYLRQEGRGIGLANKLKAYQLQDQGFDTVEANTQLGFAADLRSYDIAANILKLLKIEKLRLITNNPEKQIQIESEGLEVKERISLVTARDDFNRRYLDTKKLKMGHFL